jgi:hypothetical protein
MIIQKNISPKLNPTARVDINDLLARARAKKNKENQLNLVFLSLILCIIFIVGLIFTF